MKQLINVRSVWTDEIIFITEAASAFLVHSRLLLLDGQKFELGERVYIEIIGDDYRMQNYEFDPALRVSAQN